VGNSSGHQPHRTRITRNHSVRRQQGDAFDLCLSDEDPIERILVNGRQIINGDDVFTAYPAVPAMLTTLAGEITAWET